MACLQNKMTADMILNSKKAQETKRMAIRGKREKQRKNISSLTTCFKREGG